MNVELEVKYPVALTAWVLIVHSRSASTTRTYGDKSVRGHMSGGIEVQLISYDDLDARGYVLT